MSSSKVVKANNDVLPISGFSFQSLSRAGFSAARPAHAKSPDFMPLALFDPSELGDKKEFITTSPIDESPQAPPLPPGSFVSDADLQRYQEESYQRGLQDGKNLAERGLLNVFKGLRTAAEDLQLLREKVLRDSEDDLLALAMAVARKVISHEVVQDRQVVIRLIRDVVQNLNDRDELLIRIHPDDHALLVTSENEALKNELGAAKFTLKADPTIEVGSCQVETEWGTVDAGFEAQMEEIYRRLQEERTAGSAIEPKAAE
jgi:flagellar assembly protein FliH